MTLFITNGKIVGGDKVYGGSIKVEDGLISDDDYRGAIPKNSPDTRVIDAGENYVLPGFVDLHVHGGGGYDFIDGTYRAFENIYALHRAHGTLTLCPTLVSCSEEKIFEFLDNCRRYKEIPGFAGAHLEGPFLSPARRGAQSQKYIIEPSRRIFDEICKYSDVIARITAAPEIPGVLQFASLAASRGIAMSAGHSDALASDMQRACQQGFSQVTHLFCGTSQRTKIGSYVYGGIEEYSLCDDRLIVELIGDGHHVSRESFLLVLKCKGADKICVVTDAMRAAACNSASESYLGEAAFENRVVIEDGVAKLPDRSSFAGSVAVGDDMLRALCIGYGLDICVVSKMMSLTPAKALGLDSRLGKIADGYTADLILLDNELRCQSVIQNGVLKINGGVDLQKKE